MIFKKLKEQIEKETFHKRWLSVMSDTNNYNRTYQTYTLENLRKEPYGYSGVLAIPYGLTLDNLKKVIPCLQERLSCTIDITDTHHDNILVEIRA
jgi:hypothetical protein